MSTKTPSLVAPEALSELTDEALLDQLVHLCGHINAADYHLCTLIQELDVRNCWNRYGCSAVQWLNHRCGIAPAAARERIRTAKALVSLPLVTEAFRTGELSYSKVRAITRVARSDNEASLLNVARYTTAGQSERIFRKYRKVEDSMEAKKSYDARKVSCSRDEDGCWVIRAKLLPDQGAHTNIPSHSPSRRCPTSTADRAGLARLPGGHGGGRRRQVARMPGRRRRAGVGSARERAAPEPAVALRRPSGRVRQRLVGQPDLPPPGHRGAGAGAGGLRPGA